MDKRKKEDHSALPDLPEQDALLSPPEFPDRHYESENEEEERHSLPSFPDTLSNNGFSQAAIKDAVNPSEFDEKSEFPEPPKHHEYHEPSEPRGQTIEMEEWQPSQSTTLEEPPFRPEPSEEFKPSLPQSTSGKNSDVFVKIDKFRAARKSLKTSQDTIEEISSLLNKIRETKMREEQELASWERDIENTKARIKEVTDNIFEKVE